MSHVGSSVGGGHYRTCTLDRAYQCYWVCGTSGGELGLETFVDTSPGSLYRPYSDIDDIPRRILRITLGALHIPGIQVSLTQARSF